MLSVDPQSFQQIAAAYHQKAARAWKRWRQFRPITTWDSAAVELRQFWAYQIFRNEHRELVLRNLQHRYKHAWQDMDKFCDPTINPLRKVATMKAVTYTRPPVRRTKHPQLRLLIKRNARHLNRRLLYATKLLAGTGNALLWPVIGMRDRKPTYLDVLVIPAHEVYLEWCYDDSQWNIMAEYDGGVLLSLCVLTAEGPVRQMMHLDESLQVAQRAWADLGQPIWISLDEMSHTAPRSVAPIADLINGSIKLGMFEAFGDKITYLKSFKQAVQAGEYGVTPDQLIASPQNIWPNEVTLIDLADKNDVYEKLIDAKNLTLAGQHGVSKVAATGDYQNENHWASVAQEMLHHWEEMNEICLGIEEALWRAICEMSLVQIDPDDPTAAVRVEFQPPYPTMQDPKSNFDLAREQQRAGVGSITTYLMQLYPWIEDEEQAWQVHNQFLADLKKEMDMKRSMNIPDDPNTAGKTPQQNGATSLEQSKKFGELGANGPSMDQKELEVEKIKNGGTP